MSGQSPRPDDGEAGVPPAHEPERGSTGPSRSIRIDGSVGGSPIISGDGNTVYVTMPPQHVVQQATSTTAPARPWNIFPPSPYFTGRDQEVAALRSALVSEQRAAVSQVQAVSGLGGIGKTQLALAYAQRHRDEYEAGFFVRADSDLSLHAGLDEMARLLGLGEGLKPADLLRTVRRWLENTPKGLLILDNADTPQLVKALCAPGAIAHILVTTRVWNTTSIGVARPVRIQALSPEESVRFLLQRTGREAGDGAEEAVLKEVSEDLGHLPLALEQAGAYMAEREMRAASYVAAFRQRRAELLQERPEMGDYPISIKLSEPLRRKQGSQQIQFQQSLPS